jgi:hypothetical protein
MYVSVATETKFVAWQEKIEGLEEGQSILAPGGWSGLNGSGFLMHIVERTAKDAYSFVTLNPARGILYQV